MDLASQSWQEIPTRGDGPRFIHELVAWRDSVTDRYLVMDRTSLDAWFLTPDGAWSSIDAPGAPYGMNGAGGLDPLRHRLILFGGGFGAPRNDAWALELTGDSAGVWSQMPTLGTPPARRSNPVVVCDPPRDRLIVQGGFLQSSLDFNVLYADTWALSFVTGHVGTTSGRGLGRVPARRAGYRRSRHGGVRIRRGWLRADAARVPARRGRHVHARRRGVAGSRCRG